jgi:hypothetical protein
MPGVITGEATMTTLLGTCTNTDPTTNITSWANRTTGIFGSATADTAGAAIGMPTVWVLAGFMSMACGSGTR